MILGSLERFPFGTMRSFILDVHVYVGLREIGLNAYKLVTAQNLDISTVSPDEDLTRHHTLGDSPFTHFWPVILCSSRCTALLNSSITTALEALEIEYLVKDLLDSKKMEQLNPVLFDSYHHRHSQVVNVSKQRNLIRIIMRRHV